MGFATKSGQFSLNLKFFMCIGNLLAAMSMYHTYAWCLQRLEDAIKFPPNGVQDCFESWCACQELNKCLLEEELA